MTEQFDDQVLQLMTALGLDSENEVTFRVTRHYFRNSVPPCCIAFNVHLWDQLCNYLPHDADVIEELLETGDDAAMLCLGRDDYSNWVAQRFVSAPSFQPPTWRNGYMPCRRCVLDRAIVQVSISCPCCADREFDDDPDAPSPPTEGRPS